MTNRTLAFDIAELEAARDEPEDLLRRPFLQSDKPFPNSSFDERLPTVAAFRSLYAFARTWYAMPGGVLELGNTGYAIYLDSDPKKSAYRVLDPDGRWIAAGMDLPYLKSLAERNASDRAELFRPPETISAETTELIRRLGR